MRTLPQHTKSSAQNACSPSIEIRPSKIHGQGVFARRTLRAGQHVGEYTGRLYAADQEDDIWDGELTYLFGLSDGSTIDGAQGGNETRQLNHACAPNVEAVERRRPDGSLSLTVRTLQRIQAGDELFLDYALVIAKSQLPSDYPCRCAMHGCRGTMAAHRAS